VTGQRSRPPESRWWLARVVWLALVGAGTWLGVALTLRALESAGADLPPVIVWGAVVLGTTTAVLAVALQDARADARFRALRDALQPGRDADSVPVVAAVAMAPAEAPDEDAIVGRGADRVPYLAALVIVPRLRTYATVNFLVDTGADVTMISPTDALLLRYDYAGPTQPVHSLGGATVVFREQALLVVAGSNTGRLHPLSLPVHVAPPNGWPHGLPSILGRDFLAHFHLTLDMAHGTVTLHPNLGDDGHLTSQG